MRKKICWKRRTRPLVCDRPLNIDGCGDVSAVGLCGLGAVGSGVASDRWEYGVELDDKPVRSRYRVDEKSANTRAG
uniref:SRCR domain-containing protein n=1 Tax=Ascaris lumbricoides TaxID=6252 RepID=A0A0M3HV53_ASCLU